MTKTESVIAELHSEHRCDLCRGAGGEKGLRERAIAELRRLRLALETVTGGLDALWVGFPKNQAPTKAAKKAAAEAQAVLDA